MMLSVALALSASLSACGGGGSDSSSSGTRASSTPFSGNAPNSPTVTNPGTPTSNTPDVAVVPESGAYAAMLSTRLDYGATGDTDRSPAVVTAPQWALRGNSTSLVLSTTGTGVLSSSLFLGTHSLPSAALQLVPTTRSIQGQSTRQFLGWTTVDRYNAYAASVEWFTEAGITAVGLGQWKYIGEQQTVLNASFFNSGRQLSAGAFLMGTPTATSALSGVTSGRFSGVMQALVDDGRWGDDFAHLTATVSGTLDVATGQITLQLANPKVIGGGMGTSGIYRTDWTERDGWGWMVLAPSCTGRIDLRTGRFSCPFTGSFTGTAQGRLFGAAGDQLAATFSVSTSTTNVSIHPVAVGGLAARRTGSLP